MFHDSKYSDFCSVTFIVSDQVTCPQCSYSILVYHTIPIVYYSLWSRVQNNLFQHGIDKLADLYKVIDIGDLIISHI